MRKIAFVLALATLASVGLFAAFALGSGETTGSVTASIPDQVVTIPGTSTTVTYTIPTVTETVTVTVGTTTAPPPPPPPPLGSALPPRLPESKGATTVISPGSSVASAVSSAAAGGTILLHGGNYGTTTITSGCRKDAANPVTIASYPGETATFVGGSFGNAFYLGGCSGIRIRDVSFNAPRSQASLKIDTCQHIEVDGVTIKNAGASNSTGSQGILVNSNPGFAQIFSDDVQIWNSTISGWFANPSLPNNNQGIYYGGASSGTAGAVNGVIANNVIEDGQGGYGIQLGGAARKTIVTSNDIIHVANPYTCTGTCASGGVVWGYGSSNPNATASDTIVNNIFAYSRAYAVVASGSTPGPLSVVRNNLAFSNGLGSYLPNYGSNTLFTVQPPSLSGDPLFANYATRDLHLRAGSPAIASADGSFTPAKDHDGNPRASADLGAYGS